MQDQTRRADFEQSILPHLDAAYNLAHWLTRSDQDAEDVVQEAFLRAYKFYDGFRGGDSRAWLLMIVRNACYTWLRRNRKPQEAPFDDADEVPCPTGDPEIQLQRSVDRELLTQALDELPLEFREVLVLRELQDLTYKEIAYVTQIPIGTVMSRLARARKQLQRCLMREMDRGGAR